MIGKGTVRSVRVLLHTLTVGKISKDGLFISFIHTSVKNAKQLQALLQF